MTHEAPSGDEAQDCADDGCDEHRENGGHAKPQRDGADADSGGAGIDDQLLALRKVPVTMRALISAGATRAMTLVSGAGGCRPPASTGPMSSSARYRWPARQSGATFSCIISCAGLRRWPAWWAKPDQRGCCRDQHRHPWRRNGCKGEGDSCGQERNDDWAEFRGALGSRRCSLIGLSTRSASRRPGRARGTVRATTD